MGAAQNVLTGITERSKVLCRLKQRSVEPLLNEGVVRPPHAQLCLMNTCPDEIGTVREVSTKRIIAAAEHRERKSTLPANQRAQLPSVDKLVRQPVNRSARKLVHTRKFEHVSNVVIRKAVVEVPVESGRVGPIRGANGSKIGQLLRPGIVC